MKLRMDTWTAQNPQEKKSICYVSSFKREGHFEHSVIHVFSRQSKENG